MWARRHTLSFQDLVLCNLLWQLNWGVRGTQDQPSLFNSLRHKHACGGHPSHVIGLLCNNGGQLVAMYSSGFPTGVLSASQLHLRAKIGTHLSSIALAEYLDINQGAVGISTEELQCLLCTCCTELFCQMTPVNYQYLTLMINQLMCGPKEAKVFK